MFKESESPAITFIKAAIVPVLTIIGSSIAAYAGAAKGVTDTVEMAAKGIERVLPAFEAVITKAEAAEAASAAPASQPAAQPAETPEAEAK